MEVSRLRHGRLGRCRASLRNNTDRRHLDEREQMDGILLFANDKFAIGDYEGVMANEETR